MQASVSPSKKGRPSSCHQVMRVAHEADRSADFLARRIRAQIPQQRQGVGGGHPAVLLVVAPVAVGRLKAEELGAPTLRGDARPLGGDGLVGLIGEVAHDLPADRRIRIEQPLHDRRVGSPCASPLPTVWAPQSVTAIRRILDGRAGVACYGSPETNPRQERMRQHRPTTQTLRGQCRSAARFLALALIGLAGCSGIGTQNGTAPLPGDAPGTDRRCAHIRCRRALDAGRSRAARPRLRLRRLRQACEPVAAPQITITAPPAKGDITFVPGQETTIQYSAQGTCIGQKVQGTGVYYTARAGQKGTDRFALSAKLGTGETADRSFEVRIEE